VGCPAPHPTGNKIPGGGAHVFADHHPNTFDGGTSSTACHWTQFQADFSNRKILLKNQIRHCVVVFVEKHEAKQSLLIERKHILRAQFATAKLFF